MSDQITFEIKCPSGFILEAKPWSTGLLERFRRALKAPTGIKLDIFYSMIEAGWVSVVDSGPYSRLPVGDVRPPEPWKHLLDIDTDAILCTMRAESVDPVLYVPMHCRACNASDKFAPVDLRTLATIPIPDDVREKIARDENLEADIDGARVGFILSYGSQESRAQKLFDEIKRNKKLYAELNADERSERQAQAFLESAAVRIRTIDGKSVTPLEAWHWIRAGRRPIARFNALTSAFAEHDYGLVTEADVTCECDTLNRVKFSLITTQYFLTQPTKIKPQRSGTSSQDSSRTES